MAVYDWPLALRPSGTEFFIEPNTLRTESPLSRATQVLARPGARWVATLTFNQRQQSIAGPLDAFLAKLDGSEHEVRLFDWRRPLPRGIATARGSALITEFTDGFRFTDTTGFLDQPATPQTVSPAAQNADTVATGGWAVSTTGILLAGDYIGLGGRLYMVTADANSDSLGRATLSIRPRLRVAVPSGVAVVTTRPTARFRLVDNQQGRNSTVPGPWSTYNLSFVESLP
jgi:hypothetical protein